MEEHQYSTGVMSVAYPYVQQIADEQVQQTLREAFRAIDQNALTPELAYSLLYKMHGYSRIAKKIENKVKSSMSQTQALFEGGHNG